MMTIQKAEHDLWRARKFNFFWLLNLLELHEWWKCVGEIANFWWQIFSIEFCDHNYKVFSIFLIDVVWFKFRSWYYKRFQFDKNMRNYYSNKKILRLEIFNFLMQLLKIYSNMILVMSTPKMMYQLKILMKKDLCRIAQIYPWSILKYQKRLRIIYQYTSKISYFAYHWR